MRLAHNGNLINTMELRDLVRDQLGSSAGKRGELGRGNTSDTALVTTLLAADPDRPIETAALEVLPLLKGAFCFVFMDENTLYAARDAHGVRPLALGRLERGWVVASETAALQTIGASVVREIEPGELIAIDQHGLRSHRFAQAQPKGCVFEYVYLARPDAVIRGRVVHEARVEMGRQLAREHPVDADLVIGVPESGVPAAVGYSQESGIPFGQGFVKNAYVGPHLHPAVADAAPAGHPAQAQPARSTRSAASAWWSSTTRSCAATPSGPRSGCCGRRAPLEVHVRISSPPVQWPCFYGIDFATRAELIATGLGVEEIRASIGADSLGYISEEGMIGATAQPADDLCTACFTGATRSSCPRTAGSASTSWRPCRITVRTGHDSSIDLLALNP